MKRREFVTGLASVVLANTALAQQSSKPVIGFLSSESPALFANRLRFYREGLNEAGFAEGESVTIEYRWAEGRNELLPALAADLVARRVSVIATPGSTPGALAAQQATATIPIVIFTAGDPVLLGLVASLNRPGSNITGSTSLGPQLAPKRLALLHELMPEAKIMAVLVNPSNPTIAEATATEVQAAASTLGLELHRLAAATEPELAAALATADQRNVRGLVIAIDSFFTARREKLAQLALRHRMAAIYQYRDFAASGGIMSYSDRLETGYRLAGVYTGRILKGEKPAEMPVQTPAKYELFINSKTAKALDITVPASLLARADEVIE